MLFNSYEFIFVYLPITWFVYYACGQKISTKAATWWLVLASLIFYGYWDVSYVPLLCGSILFNYVVGRAIEKYNRKNIILFLGVVCNLLILGYYKYTGFFLSVSNDVFGTFYEIPSIILPLGISFFTFTQTAYLIDAYRGETTGYSFGDYCLFVTIFPHLIAGPVINHREMLPQFSNKELMRVDWRNMAVGITLFVMGLFKKVIIADRLAEFVNPIFSQTESVAFVESWIAALGYSLQLYFDFSAYSEMAMGLGLLFNMRLPQNFNSPYQAENIIDFWRRWHMTLGAWVKSYLYIPLGGNRVSFGRKLVNLFVAMTLVGFWHGAGWTFIVWGALHGMYLVVNNIWRQYNFAVNAKLARILTFLVVVLAWVVFRADNIGEAIDVIRGMAGLNGLSLPLGTVTGGNWYKSYEMVFRENYEIPFIRCVGWLVGMIFVVQCVKNPVTFCEERFRKEPKCFMAVCVIVLAIVALYGMVNSESEFLYFQF